MKQNSKAKLLTLFIRNGLVTPEISNCSWTLYGTLLIFKKHYQCSYNDLFTFEKSCVYVDCQRSICHSKYRVFVPPLARWTRLLYVINICIARDLSYTSLACFICHNSLSWTVTQSNGYLLLLFITFIMFRTSVLNNS